MLWLAAAWLIASNDLVREATVAAMLRDRTEFSSGFSELRFSAVVDGQSQIEVRQQLGAPLEEGWIYPPPGKSPVNVSVATATACVAVRFSDDRVSKSFPPGVCEARGIRPG